MSRANSHLRNKPKYQPLLDQLRAFAVFSVVIFHYWPTILPGGFVGVDIFFVISGYLITKRLVYNLGTGTQSLLSFLASRVRRVFPALLIVLICCLIYGAVYLRYSKYIELTGEVLLSSLFVLNISLSRGTGYFDLANELKPLMNLWSLSVEFQFYILWALLFYSLKSIKKLNYVVLFIMTTSLILALTTPASYQPKYFLLQYRIFEFSAGALLAFCINISEPINCLSEKKRCFLLALFSWLILFYSIFYITDTNGYPSIWALVPVLSACMLIWMSDSNYYPQNLIINKSLILGKISYPLFLIHWPLSKLVNLDSASNQLEHTLYLVLVLLASIFSSYYIYKYIELKVSYMKLGRVTSLLLFINLSVVLSASYILYKANAKIESNLNLEKKALYSKNSVNFLKENSPSMDSGFYTSLSKEETTDYVPKRFREFNNQPLLAKNNKINVLLIGDSFSHDLINAVFESGLDSRFTFSTKSIRSQCGNLFLPYDTFSFNIESDYQPECIENKLFHDLELRLRISEADQIWLASSWLPWQVDFLKKSISNLENISGKKVYIFGRKNFGSVSKFDYSFEKKRLMIDVPQSQILVNDQMRALLRDEKFIDVQETLCGSNHKSCELVINDMPITFDGLHLTKFGARLLGNRLKLNKLFQTTYESD